MLPNFSHLDFFGSLSDPVATMVSVDVLERHVPAVPHATTRLHGSICRLAHQAIGSVIAHRDHVRELHETRVGNVVLFSIHQPSRVADQLAQHRCLGVQFDERELNGLIARQLLAPCRARIGIGHSFIDAVLRCSQR